MQSYTIKAAACAALFALAGCERAETPVLSEGQTPAASEFTWARAALERNPNLEVIAADTQAGIFTVKVKRTGATQTIKLNELVATPTSELATTQLAVTAPPAPTPAPTEPPAVSPSVPASTAAPPATPQVAATPAPASPDEKSYTIERTGGQLKVSGPGVSIVSSGTTGSKQEAGQRTVEPLICEGQRMMHFDNRSIYVDGDAIVARGGCEIYITNSHIVASGTAVVASNNSIVHVSNSTLEGSAASFDASDGAKMYLRSSTFQGLPRRAEKSVVQDQGGNTWR